MSVIYEDAEWLKRQYLELEKSIPEMANEAGVSISTISRKLKKKGIETRTSGPEPADNRVDDPEWLHEQYIVKGKSMEQMANESESAYKTIHKKIHKCGIKTRPAGGSKLVYEQLGDYDWLYEQYVRRNESITDMAEDIGCTAVPVWRALQRHGIDTREKPMPEGEDHPSWKGGHIEYYGKSWDDQREKALERAGFQCEHTGMRQEEHKKLYNGQGLHVHHIRPFREFGIENHKSANRLSNLRVLCSTEHRRWEGIPTLPKVNYE